MFISENNFKELFVGDKQLSIQNINITQLLEIAKQVEENTLQDLLGAYQYNELLTDIQNGEPQTQKWIDFKNGKIYTKPNGNIAKYKGIIEMLCYFSYYEISINQQLHTPTGYVIANNENSIPQTNLCTELKANQRYNKAINLYNETITYINYNTIDFPNCVSKIKTYKQIIHYR